MALRFFVFTLLGLALGSAINGRKPLHSRGAQPYKHTVLAIGDTHKSYNDLVSTLQRAAFLNQDGQWANQDIDSVIHFGVGLNSDASNSDFLEAATLFSYLRGEAKEAGKDLVSVYTDRDMEGVYDYWRSGGTTESGFSPHFVQSLHDNYFVSARLPLHPAAGDKLNAPYDPDDPDTRKNKNYISRSALSFTYGGLSPREGLTPYPSVVNKLGQSLVALLQHSTTEHRSEFPHGLTEDEHWLLRGDDSVLRLKVLATLEDSHACDLAAMLLELYGVSHFVIAQRDGSTETVEKCSGKIIMLGAAARFEYTLEPEEESGWYMEVDKIFDLSKDAGEELVFEETRMVDLRNVVKV